MMKIRNFVVLGLICLTMFACKKEVEITLPLEVKTNQITEVEWTTATTGGVVPSDGGTIVVFRGVVWGKETNPTLENSNKTDDGRGTGEFVSKLTNLQAGTKYFVRAYAINSKDTVYGEEIAFTTSSWTPVRMQNVWDWWNSQSGVVKVGSGVYAWNGAKGNVLIPREDDYLASYKDEDNDWGKQPSIMFNQNFKQQDRGYYTKASPSASSKTVILVAKVTQSHYWGALINLGYETTTRFGIWSSNLGNYYVYDYSQPAKRVGKIQNNSYQFIRITYDRDKGGNDYYVNTSVDFRSKLSSIPTAANRNYNNGKLYVGGYGDLYNYGHTPQMSVVEVLYIDGIPDENEVKTYEKYLKYKYKF